MQQCVFWDVVGTPVGPIGLAATERGLCRVAFRCRAERFAGELEKQGLRPTRGGEPIRPAVEQLRRYLAGERIKLGVPVEFLGGTAFQRRTWRALRRIGYGQTRSYAWLAAAVGAPRAVRAVGQANGKNPVPIFCPCHRVIRSDGTLGGFSAGIGIKGFLLHLEGNDVRTSHVARQHVSTSRGRKVW
jgi:methylated-DNA-[protein]-cysteine S-methyltransferase